MISQGQRESIYLVLYQKFALKVLRIILGKLKNFIAQYFIQKLKNPFKILLTIFVSYLEHTLKVLLYTWIVLTNKTSYTEGCISNLTVLKFVWQKLFQSDRYGLKSRVFVLIELQIWNREHFKNIIQWKVNLNLFKPHLVQPSYTWISERLS